MFDSKKKLLRSEANMFILKNLNIEANTFDSLKFYFEAKRTCLYKSILISKRSEAS
jgi:hypothetical protein